MTIPAQAVEFTPYPPAMRVLHWIIAALVLVALPFGAVIKFITEESKTTFYMIHESLGFLVLWFMLARVAVRLIRHPPPTTEENPALKAVAATVHYALYAALIIQPILGFLMTNAYGFPLELFGLIPIPSPIGKDMELAPYLKAAHIFVGYSILTLFCLHIGGVLFHHVIRRDPTLFRML
jgi:cytochrome b561